MNLHIRPLATPDAPIISKAFGAIGWHKPLEQYQRYLQQQTDGQIQVLVAEVEGAFAGYLTIVYDPAYPGFKHDNIPEIQDLNVLPPYRRRGVATRLLDEAEARIARQSDTVGIGVGLHPGYNAAQRLYVLRGYVPDGRGVTWRNHYIEEGQTLIADDDLVLHLTKHLGVEK